MKDDVVLENLDDVLREEPLETIGDQGITSSDLGLGVVEGIPLSLGQGQLLDGEGTLDELLLLFQEWKLERDLDMTSNLSLDLLHDLVNNSRSLDFRELSLIFLDNWSSFLLNKSTKVNDGVSEYLEITSSSSSKLSHIPSDDLRNDRDIEIELKIPNT
jgi:hypothetical protein